MCLRSPVSLCTGFTNVYTFIDPSAVTKHFQQPQPESLRGETNPPLTVKWTLSGQNKTSFTVYWPKHESVDGEQVVLCCVVLLLCFSVYTLWLKVFVFSRIRSVLSSQRSPLCVLVNTVKLSQIQQSANSFQSQISSCGCFLKDKQVFIFQQSDYPGAEARPGSVSVL